MTFDKPFLPYDRQIERLKKEYGLIINDEEFAKHALMSVSYYDLVNGYKALFMKNNKFVDNLSIEYLYEFHLLDKSIQAFIMKYSLFLENMFKNLLAYVIASAFGVNHKNNGYLDSNHYQTYSSGISYNENIYNEILPILNSDSPKCKMPTKHYVLHHNHVPPWILFKNISFGDAINLFTLLKSSEKEYILNTIFKGSKPIEYSQKVDIIRNGLLNIRELRNLAAHNLHFVQFRTSRSIQPKQLYYELPHLIYLTPDLKQPLNIDKKACKGLYSAILIFLLFLETPYLKTIFITDLKNAVFNNATNEQNSLRATLFDNYCKLTALPSNLFDRLDKFQQSFKI